MPNEATFETMARLADKEAPAISFIADPTWNIEGMEPLFYMVNPIFTGMYCFKSNSHRPRSPQLTIDGDETEPPLVPPLMPMFGQMVDIKARKYLKEYGRAYAIRYAGAIDAEGLEIPAFYFTLTTLPKRERAAVPWHR